MRQGCPMLAWLFNIYLDMVVKEAQDSFHGGVTLNACKVQVLLFADDTVLVADTEEDLKHNIAALQEAVREHKLGINWGKTNTMVISRGQMECNIEVEEYSVESVEEVVHLGKKFSADRRMEGELNRRIASSMSAVGALQKKVFGSRELSKKAKVEVYNAIVVPMMSYGCESWLLRKREKTRLQASKISVLRKIAGMTRLEYIRNEEIRRRLQQRSVVEVVKKRREKWWAKVMEKIGSLVEKVMTGEVKGRRPRGRPRK